MIDRNEFSFNFNFNFNQIIKQASNIFPLFDQTDLISIYTRTRIAKKKNNYAKDKILEEFAFLLLLVFFYFNLQQYFRHARDLYSTVT